MKKKTFLGLLTVCMLSILMFACFTACEQKVENVRLNFVVEGETISTIETSGNEVISIPNNPQKEGYIFDGWFWDKDVWSQTFTANSLLNAPISKDMSVYAKLTPIEYSITYHLDGGIHTNPASYTIETSTITLADAQKEGYSFDGWYKDASFNNEVISIAQGNVGNIELYAKYTVNQYTISFASDGGSTVEKIIQNYNSAVSAPSEPTKAGYIFGGWYIDGADTAYNFTTMPAKDILLKAKWTPEEYSISYNLNGGINGENPDKYTIESSNIVLADANREGYTFEGWYQNNNKVEKIEKGSTGNIVLTARWSLLEYIITYDNTKSANNNNPVKYTIESDAIVLLNLEKRGYTFEGWYKGVEKVTEIAKGSTGNLTLTAKWSVVDCEIIYYNVDGATNSNPANYDVEDNPLELIDANKDGYTFLGWYSDSGFENKVTEIAVGVTGKVKLYAKWEIIEYTITYENTKGAVNSNATKYTIDSADIMLSEIIASGYNFVGWYNGETITTKIENGTTGNIVLTAKWNVIEYTITYENTKGATNNNVTKYTIESDSITLSEISVAGYMFDGWYCDETKVEKITTGSFSDLTLTAKWTAIEYSITFIYDNNIGDYVDVNKNPMKYTTEDEFDFISLVNKVNGYSFNGWYTDKNVGAGTKINGIKKGMIGDITLYAQWDVGTYTITYRNVKSAINTNPTAYNVDTETFIIKDISLAGYTFDGWYNGETKITSIVKGTTGNLTLTAKWTPIEYTITYENAKGATNNNITKYTIESADITLSEITTTSYTFDGWYDGETKVEKIATGSYGNKTLTAKWTAIEYTISYENTKGATNNNAIKYTIESEDITLAGLTVAGYTFDGWFENKIKVETIATGSYGNKTLTAQWTPITYYATFIADDVQVGEKLAFNVEEMQVTAPAVPEKTGYTGEWENYTFGLQNITIEAVYMPITYTISYSNTKNAANSNPTSYNIESDAITLSEISAVGYTFDGWYDGETKVETIATGSYGNKTLTAKWTAVEYMIKYENTKGATNSNATKYTIESADITLSDICATGYTFDGWYDGDTKVETIAKGTYGNRILTAKWTAIEYTITYENTKGATNNNVTKYTIESEDITLLGLSAVGYTFDGWYDGETKVETITKGIYGNLELEAKWSAIEYKITYLYDNEIGDFAEGTVGKATYTIEDEFEFTSLVCKTIGYSFSGWFTEKNVGTGTKVNGVAKGTTRDITVYAQFGLEEYHITYNNVNGATNSNPTYYTVETETFKIYPLSIEGYTFNGWFIDKECSVSANLTITKGSNGDITLYAKWTPITYTIEYVTYGGTTTGNPATYIVTDTITFNDAILSGYVFKGWYTAAEGGNKVTGISAGSTGNVVLYAHWDYISTITFESNGGSTVNPIINVEGTVISAPTAPTKEHYTFTDWYSDAALTKKYTFATQPAEDITLYAKWTPVKYNIEYMLNGGTNNKNNVATYTVEDKVEFHAPSKVGHTFIGWFTDAEFTSAVVTELKVGTSGKITLYAHYSINQYTISFESNGGTSVSAITQNYATNVTTPEAPAKNGYTFAGWYTNASLTSKYTFSTMPAEDITLYAKWNLATYNITYNLNGGTNNSSNPATYTITSAKITFANPTKTGYNFEGWYTDAEYTTTITEIVSGSYGDVELFAKWTAIEYTVTYITADEATHSNTTVYTIETDLTTLSDATLKGHTFDGWFAEDSFATKVTTVAGGEIGDKTIYAKFKANTYNVWLDGNEEVSCVVSFNLNGAEGTIENQTVTPTVTLKYPNVPIREGYIFAGWYNNENCTGSPYDFTAVVTSDTTLYAKWVKVENATAIAVNGSSTITLNGKTEQMLMFVPLVSGNITITASGSYDTFGVLYNSEKSALIQDDDNASDGKNFLIVYNVTAGETYYIGARAFSSTTTGNATISITGDNTVLDGGYTITATKGTATYGQNFTFNLPNVRDGYKFLGYADINGVMYTDLNGASVKVWDKDEETTLYSVWERTVYTVTFETSGGSAIEPIQLAFGERLNIGQYVTTREGFTFRGWYLDGEEYNATTMPDHNITLTAYWKNFALGSIKYDIDKTAVSVNDEITAELFDAICLDTNGNLAIFTVTISGTQEAGNTISVRLVATSGNKTKQVTITDVKVYGMPTLTVNNSTKDYINPNEFTATAWGASGTDSFGNATTIRVYIDGEYQAGDTVTVTIDSVDPAGNITSQQIESVKVYDKPVITYNQEKTAISVNDTISAELFSATSQDSFGEALTVAATKYSGTLAAGNTVVIRLTATDSKGNIMTVDVSCKVYGMPTISNATKTEFTETDEITPETLGITAKDTYNMQLVITLAVKEGEQVGGVTMIYTATVIDIAGNVIEKDYSIKIYGTPTITVGRTDIKVTEDPVNSSSVLKAVAKDNFGNTLQITTTLKEGELKGGTQPVYTLTATDKLGNVATKDVAVNVYDQNDISLSYSAGASDVIKLSSKGEEFFAHATDSFGNACDISIDAAEGYALKGGEIIDLYVVATDKAGNKKRSELITNVKIYDIPTITPLTEFVYEDTDLQFFYTVRDSFGEELFATITVEGNMVVGEMVCVSIKAEDDAKNILDKVLLVTIVENQKQQILYKGITYTLNSDKKGYSVTAFDTAEKNVEIISNISGIPVVTINCNVFSGCSTLTSINFVGDINKWVEIDGLGNLMSSSRTLYINGKEPTEIELTTATKINSYAFYNCYSLTSVTIGNSVTSIGNYAFYGCSNLTSITIPDSVTSIGSNAFYGCSSLESITIPFVGSSLSAVSASSSTLFGYVFGTSSYAGGTEVKQYYSSSRYIICYIPTTLKSVTITGGNVLYGAFYGCSGLTSVTISDSVTSIGDCAFYNCNSLTSVTIGNSVTSIGDYAFKNCSSLTNITIPNSVMNIGWSFLGCSSLTNIYYVGDINKWVEIDGLGNLMSSSRTLYINGEVPTVIELTTATKINSYAFRNCSRLTSVTIGNSVKSIGSSAFEYCNSLKSITIPDSVKSIGDKAFSECSSFTNIYYVGDINKWVEIDGLGNLMSLSRTLYINGEVPTVIELTAATKINSYAFRNCSKLTSITIPNSVKSIGSSAFLGCSSLTSVTIGNSVESIGNSAFEYCNSLKSITIPNSVTSIGDEAFYSCSNLARVTIPNSVTSIGDEAFYSCSNLARVTIPNSVTSIGDYAFYNCDGLTSVTIPDSVTSIGEWAFSSCSSLTSVTIGNGVTSIGQNPFDACFKLKYNEYNNAYYLGNNTNPYVALIKAKNTVITTIQIHSNTKVLAAWAFAHCSSLINVTIPDSVTSIGQEAFYYCSGLTSVTIGNSVNSIEYGAFYHCSNLTRVTFKNTRGWYVSSATMGTSVNVTNTTQNATYLTSTYYNYYWKRK